MRSVTEFKKIEIKIPFIQRKKLPVHAESYDLAKEIGEMTETIPTRWLRDCIHNKWAVKRAIIDFKEGRPRKKAALFIFLLKKYKQIGTHVPKETE